MSLVIGCVSVAPSWWTNSLRASLISGIEPASFTTDDHPIASVLACGPKTVQYALARRAE
jgi:hypothetical protein